MTDDAKADEVLDTLRGAFASNLRTAVAGLPAHQALQLADVLCTVQMDVLAGMRVSYRAREPIDGAGIAEAWARGGTLRDIMRDHNCSRATAYNYHPTKGPKGRAAIKAA